MAEGIWLQDKVSQMFMYSTKGLQAGEYWRLLTYALLHGGFMHLFWNMLGLFFFAPALERALGKKKFVTMYVLAAFLGALIPYIFFLGSKPAVPAIMVGASGAVMAVVGALAVIAPNIEVLIYFVLPVKLRTLAIVYFIFSLLQSGQDDGVAHSTHLVGLIVGVLFALLFANRGPRPSLKRMVDSATGAEKKPQGHGLAGRALHVCAVCSATEISAPNEDFRVCSKCDGALEYCSKHLKDHTHKTQSDSKG